MSETQEPVSVHCGFCGKGFKLRPDQLGRKVRCPHCKVIVVIEKPTEFARTAVEALGEAAAAAKPPVTASSHRHVVLARGGVRSKGLAIAWAAVLGVAALGLVIGLAVLARPGADEEGPADVRPQPTAPAPGTAVPGRLPAPEAAPAAPAPGTAVPGRFPAPEAAPPMPAPAPAPEAAPPTPAPAPEAAPDVQVMLDKVFDGYQGDTATYIVGRAVNNTPQAVRGLEIEAAGFDDAGAPIGKATALIRRLDPGENAVYVAVWNHAAGVRARNWGGPNYRIDPAAVPQLEAKLVIPDVIWHEADRGEFATTGNLRLDVGNAGPTPVAKIEIDAVIYDTAGAILSATRGELFRTVAPGEKLIDVRIPYERALKSKIGEVKAHIQGVARP